MIINDDFVIYNISGYSFFIIWFCIILKRKWMNRVIKDWYMGLFVVLYFIRSIKISKL